MKKTVAGSNWRTFFFDEDGNIREDLAYGKSPEYRPNHRITKCCCTCRYFWYTHEGLRTGYCTVPHAIALPKKKNYVIKPEVYPLLTKIKHLLTRTHVSAVCDRFAYSFQIKKFYREGKCELPWDLQ